MTVLLCAGSEPLPTGDLTTGEAAQFARVPGAVRRRSWLAARRQLRRALTACGRPSDTAAYSLPSASVSLTHSAELAVAAVACAPVAGVGVDLELDRKPDPRTARFFLSADESAWAAGRPAELLRLWTVKEALFKADPDNAGTVLADYLVADPAARRGRAHRDGHTFRYATTQLRRGALTVAVLPERTSAVQTVEYDQVTQRISALVAVPAERLTPEVTIAELVPDSFMFIEVAVDLQEEFDVVLTQDDLKDIVTVGDLVSVLRRRQGCL
jgi:acyl carrier protein/phosphopantetheinyl transferase